MSRPLSCAVVCLALAGFAGTASAQDAGTQALIDSCTAKVGDRLACTDVVTQIDAQLFALDGNGTLKKALSLESGAQMLALIVSSFNGKFGALNSRVEALEQGQIEWTARLGALDEEVQGYKGKVKALEADYAALTTTIEGWVSQTDAAVADLQAKLAAYQGDNLSYQQQVVALQEFAESAIAGLDGRVATNESEIAGIQAVINDPNFEKVIAASDEYIGALPGIRQDLLDANTELDELGGRVTKLEELAVAGEDAGQCFMAYYGSWPRESRVALCCASARAAEATGATSFIEADLLTESEREAIFGQGARAEFPVWNIIDGTWAAGPERVVVNASPEDVLDPGAIIVGAGDLYAALPGTVGQLASPVSDGARIAALGVAFQAWDQEIDEYLAQLERKLDLTFGYYDGKFLEFEKSLSDAFTAITDLQAKTAKQGEGLDALRKDVGALWQAYDATAQESSDNRKGIIGLWEFVDEIAQDTSRNSKAIVGLQGEIADLTKQVDGLRTELHTIGDSFARGYTVRVAYVASTEGGTTFDGIDVADVATYPGADYTVDFAGFDVIDLLNGDIDAPCSEVKTKGGEIVMFDEATPLRICVGDPGQITPGIGWVTPGTAHTMHTGDGGFNMVMTLAESHEN